MKRPSTNIVAERRPEYVADVTTDPHRFRARPKRTRVLRISLAGLREAVGVSQSDIARASGMAQPNVSRLEATEGGTVVSLARYARALGGELEVAVVIDGRRYLLALGQSDAPEK